jgi:hypothetical protein
MLIISNMGDQVWLITSRQTEPDLIHNKHLTYSRAKDVQLINVWVEYAVDKTNAGRLVGILVGKLDVDFP